MSVSEEYFISNFQLGVERNQAADMVAEPDDKKSYGILLERARWTQVVLGAIALGMYVLLTATSGAIWPVLLGPFMLVGIARLMGLRSLWK